jgi:hypothetical protein
VRRYLLTAPLLALASAATAAEYRVNFEAQPGQYSRMMQGEELIDSAIAQTVVRVVEPSEWLEGRASVFVVTFNATDHPYNFGPENVSVILPDGTRQAMASFDALIREEKGRRRRRAFALALGAFGRGMSNAQAGQYNGTVYSNDGSRVATFSGTDQAAKAQADAYASAQTQSDANMIRERNAEGLAALGDVLRTTTVDPNKVVGGRVLFAFPKAWRKDGDYPVTVEVMAGGVAHSFRATITRR